jgi:putative ABC transport system permease protein
MEIIKLALRNLSRQKKRTFLLGGAIAFGIMIVTLIDGFAGAFLINISENFANLTAGHIFVEGVEKTASGKEYQIVRDDAALIKAVADAGIPYKFLSKHSTINANLNNQGRASTLVIDGVDLSRESFISDRLVFVEGGMAGMKEENGIIMAEPVAKRLGLHEGDRVEAQMKTYTGQQNMGEFRVAGITVDPGILGSMAGYANKSYVNKLLALGPDDYQSLCVYLPSLDGMDKYGKALYDKVKAVVQTFDRDKAVADQNPVRAFMNQSEEQTWTGVKYRVLTLNDSLAQVKQIADALKTASTIILLILFVIIMVGILNTFRIIMYERIREIGTMRSIGMQRDEVRNLFLFEAIFLALGGALAGLAFSTLIMGVISLFNIGMNSPLFIILRNGHMTFKIEFLRTSLNILIVAALTLLAASIPARSAARMDPAEALRTVK